MAGFGVSPSIFGNSSWMNVTEPISSSGFSGAPANAAGAAAGGGFNWNQAAGIMGLANMGLGMMGMSNTGRSLQGAYDMAGLMSDINMGKDLFAVNKDIFEQKDAPRWTAKFSVNDPFYRQQQTRQVLMNPGLAGRYANWAVG